MKLSTLLIFCIVSLIAAVPTNLFAAERIELKVWPKGAPGETGDIGPERELPPRGEKKVIRLTDVSEPTITVYQPPKDKANGCCVVVCPGGGYSILAWDLEGTEVAEWLDTIGVTSVVLKYRVPRRDKESPHVAPLQDAQRAIRLVRKNAKQWGIDPQRVGVLGFSAGGHLTVLTGTQWDQTTYEKIDETDQLSCRPDFLIPIYAAYLGDKKDDSKLSSTLRINKETPPTFLAVTLDDKMRGLHAGLLLAELKKAGVPAEAHIFVKGGHGYGLRPSANAVSGWPKLCEHWLRTQGFLDTPKPSP
jgi:acetyl esterase/lipase